MNFKKLVLSFTLASAAVLGTGVAQAACTYYGPVEEVYTNGSVTYAYVSPPSSHAVPPYVYYFGTTDPEYADTISNSLHKNIWIRGNAGACPASGTYRYGGIVTSFYEN